MYTITGRLSTTPSGDVRWERYYTSYVDVVNRYTLRNLCQPLSRMNVYAHSYVPPGVYLCSPGAVWECDQDHTPRTYTFGERGAGAPIFKSIRDYSPLFILHWTLHTFHIEHYLLLIITIHTLTCINIHSTLNLSFVNYLLNTIVY